MARRDSRATTSGRKSRSSGSDSDGARSRRRGSTRTGRKSSSGRDGRSSSGSDRSDLPDYSLVDPDQIDEAVDVYLDVPVLMVEEIRFELDDLRAYRDVAVRWHVSARLGDPEPPPREADMRREERSIREG
jgi:hypothetical protein